MSPEPVLSVVMPVYNALPHLDESIASILDQTLGDFELVIRDDASTDGSRAALRRWAAEDTRIVLTEGDRRLGPAESSEWVVRQAGGQIVARMDADDIAHPERLRRQLAVLDADSSIDAVGTLWEGVDELGRSCRSRDRWRLARSSPFAPFPHSSLMIRREAFERVGGYRPECTYWEDVDLYLRLAACGRIAVLPEALVFVRHTTSSPRVGDDRAAAAESYDRMFRCVGEFERGRRYDGVLEAEPPRRGRLRPEVFAALGAVELWAGGRPRMLSRVLRRGRLRADRETAAALVWSAWAGLSPGTLRQALRVAHRLRDRRTGRRIRDGVVYEWVPSRPPEALWSAAATTAIA